MKSKQLMMGFMKEDARQNDPQKAVAKEAYYLCISGMQKAIRRGNRDVAVKLARVAWKYDHYKLWKRLFTVYLEDCAPIKEVVHCIIDMFGPAKDWKFIEKFISLMCKMPHSRETSSFADMANKRDKFPLVYADFPEEFKGFVERGLCEGNFEVYRKPGHFAYDSEVVGFSERCYKSYDWEHLSIFLPFLVECHPEETPIFDESPALFVDVLYEGILPLSAVDQHTSLGNMVNRTFWSKRGDLLRKLGFTSQQTFCDALWTTFGSSLVNVYPRVYSHTCPGAAKAEVLNVIPKPWLNVLLPVVDDYASLVRWCLDKKEAVVAHIKRECLT